MRWPPKRETDRPTVHTYETAGIIIQMIRCIAESLEQYLRIHDPPSYR